MPELDVGLPEVRALAAQAKQDGLVAFLGERLELLRSLTLRAEFGWWDLSSSVELYRARAALAVLRANLSRPDEKV